MRPYSSGGTNVVPIRTGPVLAPIGLGKATVDPTAAWLRDMPDPTAGEAAAADGSIWIRVDEIRTMPNQPRQYFDPDEMAIFIATIAREGQQDPVAVKRISEGKYKYGLIGGERRWRAATALNLSHLRSVIKNPANRFEEYKLAVIDNCDKAELWPLDTSTAIDELLKSAELRNLSESQQIDALMGIFGKKAQWIQYHRALLNLDPRVKTMMHPTVPEEKRLGTLAAAFISTIHNGDEQVHVAEHTIAHKLSDKQMREYARRRADQKGFSVGSRPLRPSDDFKRFRNFERRLSEDLGLFKHMSANRTVAMFGSRPRPERTTMLRRIQEHIDRLVEFRQTLKEVDEKANRLD